MARVGKVLEYSEGAGKLIDLDEGDITFTFSSVIPFSVGDIATYDVGFVQLPISPDAVAVAENIALKEV